MQINEIKPKNKIKKTKRVGRGGKRGTYSGRGIKGQKARAGRKLAPSIREVIKRYPKLRGYRAQKSFPKYAVTNLAELNIFEEGEKVTPKNLLEKGLVRRIKGRTPRVKILGNGDLKKKLSIEDCQTSKTAKEKIEKAGGTVK